MRRALYRSTGLLILCLLVLALSVPAMGTGSTSVNEAHIVSSAGSSSTTCTSDLAGGSQLLGWPPVLEPLATASRCASPPSTVLIDTERLSQIGAVGATTISMDAIAQSTASH